MPPPPPGEDFSDRFVHVDGVHGPLDGHLVLPQAFGAVALGETFSAYVSLANFSGHAVRAVGLKCELQSDTGRTVLFETPQPVEALGSGQRRDLVLEHHLKEAGPHTLVCSAVYTDVDGSRRYLPQYFRFTVGQPLSVRTKVRPLPCGGGVLLEASVENLTQGALHVEGITCEAAPGMVATEHAPPSEDSSVLVWPAPATPPPLAPGPLTPALARQRVLAGHGCALHAVFHIQRATSATAEPATGVAALPSPPGSLGKLEIRWRGRFGDGGRLQTQTIQAPAAAIPALAPPASALSVRLVVPRPQVELHVPFEVTVRVVNGTAARTPPLLLKATHSGSGPHASGSATPLAAPPPSGPAFGGGVVLECGGPVTVAIGELGPGKVKEQVFTCLPLAVGVCRLPGVQLLEEPRVGVGQARGVEAAPPADVLVVQ